MSDEQENVVPAADVPPAQPVEDTPPAPPAEEQPALPADDTPPAPPADDPGAGGAAEVLNGNDSRTGFVETPARTGDPCVCPDGRPGTVTVFAGNLAVCLPNQG